MTAESFKHLISSPLALFILMCAASVGNGVKQLATVKQTGKPMTCLQYWAYWPETVSTIISNVLAFVALSYYDLLNAVSAIGVGYGLNSLSDLITKGGRSYAIKSTPDDPAKMDPKP